MDWVALGSFFAGLLGGYTIKAVMTIRTDKSSGNAKASGKSVAQSGNVAGGHIAGQDIKINHK